MSKKKIVYVDGGFNSQYKKFLDDNILGSAEYITMEKNTKGKKFPPDLMIFTGGADVNPEYYGENKGKYTNINKERDLIEYDYAIGYPSIPKIGICRGSQLLCVAAGGSLIQHVENHTSPHGVSLQDEHGVIYSNIKVSSTHHQMMYIERTKHKLLGYSTNYKSNVYLDGNNAQKWLYKDFLEPEIVYFKDINALAIQSHPEFDNVQSMTKQRIANIIIKELNL